MSEPLIPPTPSDATYAEVDTRGPIADTDDPIGLFRDWLSAAKVHELNDANAMALATVDSEGLPDVRMVLLKDVSSAGFTFYTHATSAKGQQIEYSAALAGLCFHWKSLRRQVRVRGKVIRGDDDEADAYFASRARISQLGAWASDQSQPLAARTDLEARLAGVQAEYGEAEAVPRPPHWVGYCVVPWQIEFWQDQPFRLHDRLQFMRSEQGWTRQRLNP